MFHGVQIYSFHSFFEFQLYWYDYDACLAFSQLKKFNMCDVTFIDPRLHNKSNIAHDFQVMTWPLSH